MTEEQKKGIKEAGSVSAYIERVESENQRLKAECTLYRDTFKQIKKQLKHVKQLCEGLV